MFAQICFNNTSKYLLIKNVLTNFLPDFGKKFGKFLQNDLVTLVPKSGLSFSRNKNGLETEELEATAELCSEFLLMRFDKRN